MPDRPRITSSVAGLAARLMLSLAFPLVLSLRGPDAAIVHGGHRLSCSPPDPRRAYAPAMPEDRWRLAFSKPAAGKLTQLPDRSAPPLRWGRRAGQYQSFDNDHDLRTFERKVGGLAESLIVQFNSE